MEVNMKSKIAVKQWFSSRAWNDLLLHFVQIIWTFLQDLAPSNTSCYV